MDPSAMAAQRTQRERQILAAISNYGKRLAGFIRRRVPSDEDAEDILQDVWLQLARVVDLDPIGSVGAWLFRVARNRIIDRSRKQQALPVSRIFTPDDDESTIEEWLFIEPMTPEDEALRKLFWQELFRALEELPVAQRQVFILNEIEGRTFEEISQQTGEKVKTLISRKRYAIHKLRERLADLRNDLTAEFDTPED